MTTKTQVLGSPRAGLVSVVVTDPGTSQKSQILSNVGVVTAAYQAVITVNIAATEAPDTAAIVAYLPVTLTVAATEAPDTAAITAVYNQRFVQIAATESPDTVAIHLHATLSGILVDIAATEAPDTARVLVYEAPFSLADIAVTEASDTAAITLNVSTRQIRIRATEAPDTAAVFVATEQSIVIATTEAPDRCLIVIGDRPLGPWYFAWADASETTFIPTVHARWDEHIFELEYIHDEGQAAHLSLTIKNPRIPLLGTGRNSWAWLAKDIGGTPIPRGFFRVVGAPADMAAEKVKLDLVAMPLDMLNQKRALASSLMVRPYWDPVFIEESRRLDPDSVLEGYSASWHIDPVTHQVSVSDWIEGEDGLEVIAAEDAFYNSLKTSIDQPPLKNVVLYLNVSWEQYYLGTIDMGHYTFASDTGGGIAGSWPKAGTGIGQGWTVRHAAAYDYSTQIHTTTAKYDWKDENKRHAVGDTIAYSYSFSLPEMYGATGQQTFITANQQKIIYNDQGELTSNSGSQQATIFFFWDVVTYYVLEYEAKRTRNEQVRFTLPLDLQPMFTDPGGKQADFAQDSELIKLNGKVGQEGFYGIFRGTWEPNTSYSKWDVVTTVIDGFTYAYQVTRDHISLPTFDFLATATAWQSGMWLDSGTNVYYGGAYWQVMVSGNWTQPPSDTQTFDPYFQQPLFVRTGDPHSGSQLYTQIQNFVGYWHPGMVLLSSNIVIAPDGQWYRVAVEHTADATFDRFADDVTGALLYSMMLNPPPIGDISLPQYFPTDRGLWSIEYGLTKARARLLNRARNISLSYDVRGDLAWTLDLRSNAHFTDARLPGGQVAGKITKLEIKADAKSANGYRGTITIKPVAGTGANPPPADPGVFDWATDDYIDPGYSYRVGQQITAVDINYSYPDPQAADDGLRFPLDYSTAVISEVNEEYVNPQPVLAASIPSTTIAATPDYGELISQATGEIIAMYQASVQGSQAWHILTLKPVQNGPFSTEWILDTSDVVLPQQITIS